MDSRTTVRLGVRRILILFLISLGLAFAGSELAFYFQKEPSDRAPAEVELVIPAGTASRIAIGMPVPDIPEEMVFVLGDTLVVRNEDEVDHQLGPLWIPPHSTAKLTLEEAERYALSCSFQPTRYQGLTVKPPITWGTRLIALGLTVPATTMFLFVYSLLIWPIKSGKSQQPVARTT